MTLAAPSVVDLQGYERLRASAARNDPAALGEAAVQFEALVIGMLLESARSASLGDGLFDGSETEQYLELMDGQVALELARAGGLGFANTIVRQLDAAAERGGAAAANGAAAVDGYRPSAPTRGELVLTPRPRAPRAPAAPAPVAPAPARIDTPEQFVERFLPEASVAAAALGVEPRVLLAQAALETGWGKSIPTHPDGRPANNLFGIKASGSWDGARVGRWTIEHVDGAIQRRREQFRAYPDSASSFADYVRLIAGSPRYAAALGADSAEGYARAVADAGYATDPEYAEKWLAVYRSEPLRRAALKTGGAEPTQ